MFYGKRIKKLELEIKRLHEINEQLHEEVKSAKNYTFATGEKERKFYPYSLNGFYDVPKIKTLPIQDVLKKVLDNAGLTPVYQSEKPEQVWIQESASSPQPASNEAKPNEHKPVDPASSFESIERLEFAERDDAQ